MKSSLHFIRDAHRQTRHAPENKFEFMRLELPRQGHGEYLRQKRSPYSVGVLVNGCNLSKGFQESDGRNVMEFYNRQSPGVRLEIRRISEICHAEVHTWKVLLYHSCV